MDLCKALLLWYESQKRNSRNGAVVDDPILLFKKVSHVNNGVSYKALLRAKMAMKWIFCNHCMANLANSNHEKIVWLVFIYFLLYRYN